MKVFLDFEASSLARAGYPIEVGWAFETGETESHLIRPAPGWTDWDARAEAIHGIDRATLERDGADHATVARRMVDVLAGHDLLASAPSWDGKWLSALLRAAGLPRHTLRLRDTEDAQTESARAIMNGVLAGSALDAVVADLLREVADRAKASRPAHRALADACAERDRWITLCRQAETRKAQDGAPASL